MANMFDYLDWYGDLTFDQVPFNEVDALVLANLSYVEFKGVVPGPGEGTITMAEAAPAYQAYNGKLTLYSAPSFTDPVVELLPQKMARGRRFRSAKLGNYVVEINAQTAEQFAALTVELPNGLTYVSFRGTDDTLVGWHENFDMAYEVVPSQQRATSYLDEVAVAYAGPIHCGGHSKGGNLAVFATATCADDTRSKVERVWNMDGPGFDPQVISHVAYAHIQDLVRLYVPRFDIVGQLLCRQTPAKVVASSEKGMLQHSATTWEVMRDELVSAEPQEINPIALSYSKDFNEWFAGASSETHERVFGEFFGACEDAQVETLTQLCSGNPRMLARLVRQLMQLDTDAQHYAVSLVMALTGSYMDEAMDLLDKDAQRLIANITRKADEAIDPNAPLSAAELHEFRKHQASQQVVNNVLAVFGDTRAQRLHAVGALVLVGLGAGLVGWFSSRHAFNRRFSR